MRRSLVVAALAVSAVILAAGCIGTVAGQCREEEHAVGDVTRGEAQ
jgi:predicted small secreted protein